MDPILISAVFDFVAGYKIGEMKNGCYVKGGLTFKEKFGIDGFHRKVSVQIAVGSDQIAHRAFQVAYGSNVSVQIVYGSVQIGWIGPH